MSLKKYYQIYTKFLYTSLASELEYKTNIIIDLLTANLSLIGSIFLLSIFFQNNEDIGGWKFEMQLSFRDLYRLKWITNLFNPKLLISQKKRRALDFVL